MAEHTSTIDTTSSTTPTFTLNKNSAETNGTVERTTNPKISIKLRTFQRDYMADKIDATERFQMTRTPFEIDMNLGQGTSVSITKGTKNPAGTFTITIVDSSVSTTDKSSIFSEYDHIEPMNIIEIRMAQNPSDSELPIMLRGFVTEITKDESIGSNGAPVRTVRISGHDYGKIFQLIQIIYINNAVVGDNILHGWQFSQKTGADVYSTPSVSDFISEIIAFIAENFILNFPWEFDSKSKEHPFKKLTSKVSSHGRVHGHLVNQWPGGGSLYSLISQVCDIGNGFNEFFTVDEEDDVKVVLRPTPYIKPDGNLISPAGDGNDWFPEEITVTDADIMSISISRSDEQTANYFWVKNPSFMLNNDMYQKMESSFVNDKDYFNCMSTRYGVRMMENTIYLGAPDGMDGNPSSENQGKLFITEEAWKQQHIEVLREVGRDAVVFERGTIRLKGNENIKAGGFLNVQRRGVTWRCYVQQVTHTYEPFNGYYTTVNFVQGTGFIARGQMQKPYTAEKGEYGAYGKPEGAVFNNYDNNGKFDNDTNVTGASSSDSAKVTPAISSIKKGKK